MFAFNHFNFNVLDLEKSLKFYEEALGLKEVRRKEAEDGSFILVYLGDGKSSFTLELTWLKDRTEKYDLERKNSILPSQQIIMKKHTRNTKKWE